MLSILARNTFNCFAPGSIQKLVIPNLSQPSRFGVLTQLRIATYLLYRADQLFSESLMTVLFQRKIIDLTETNEMAIVGGGYTGGSINRGQQAYYIGRW